MLAATTLSDTGSLVWSPARDKMAYITSRGLQVYISDLHSDDEKYITLSTQNFSELSWSAEGNYLTGRAEGNMWYVFYFEGTNPQRVFNVKATSLDWFDDEQVVYVPEAGGLVLVDLRNTHHPIRLAG